MQRWGHGSRVRILAPAKVNLFLKVLAREDSGYHQIETLFAALEFGDTLTLGWRGSGVSLEVEGAPLGLPEDNLAYRAAQGFLELAGVHEGVEVRLEKRIPVQAGLGGGSSDAGATLGTLAAVFPGRVETGDLFALARRLGSDVPFFLSRSPLALAWGRGDRLLALPPLPRVPVVLALPPRGMRTPEAYRLLAEKRSQGLPASFAGFRTPGRFRSWEGIAEMAENDFESVVFEAAPELHGLREAMQGLGSDFSLLSGSGSALFAVFSREDRAARGVASLEAEFPDCSFVLTHTLSTFPDPIPDPGVEG